MALGPKPEWPNTERRSKVEIDGIANKFPISGWPSFFNEVVGNKLKKAGSKR